MLPQIFGSSSYFSSPFSQASEFLEFAQRSETFMRHPEMLKVESDMEDAGQDSAAFWPEKMLEWVWSRPGEYPELQRCAQGCVREVRLHGMM
jgi:hypothetical protein